MYAFGAFELDTRSHELRRGGVRIKIQVVRITRDSGGLVGSWDHRKFWCSFAVKSRFSCIRIKDVDSSAAAILKTADQTAADPASGLF